MAYSHGFWQGASVPYHGDIATGLLERFQTWHLASLRAIHPRERDREIERGKQREREIKTKMETTFVFYDLVSKVLHSHFCFILVTRSQSLNSAQPQGEEN